MGFWGMDESGNQARSAMSSFGNTSSEQMKAMLAKSGISGAAADKILGELQSYYSSGMAGGMKSPEELQAMGVALSPETRGMIDQMSGRMNTLWGMEQNRPKAQETYDAQGRIINNMKARNEGNKEDIEGEISGTADRAMGRAEGTYGDLTRNIDATAGGLRANIDATSGSLRDTIDSTYNPLRADNAQTYAGIKAAGEDTFGEEAKTLDLLAPGGQATAARTARSFAPQVADTMQRMRRAGIDPNSPEAATQLNMVETSRSRAMDDNMADATASYVDKKSNLGRAKLGFMSDADKARLGGEVDLSTRQGGLTADVIANQGRDTRGVITDQGTQTRAARVGLNQEQQGIDATRSDARKNLIDTTFGREQDLSGKQMGLEDAKRAAEMEDVDRFGNVVKAFNENDMTAQGLRDAQLQKGVNYFAQDQQMKDTAAQGMAGVGQGYRQSSQFDTGAAMDWGKTGYQAQKDIYDMESQNAGWGTKMLGGIAASFAGGLAGGLGTGLAGKVAGPAATSTVKAGMQYAPTVANAAAGAAAPRASGYTSPYASSPAPTYDSFGFAQRPAAPNYFNYQTAPATPSLSYR